MVLLPHTCLLENHHRYLIGPSEIQVCLPDWILDVTLWLGLHSSRGLEHHFPRGNLKKKKNHFKCCVCVCKMDGNVHLNNLFKGTNGRQKTYEIFHVYCIFYSGFMCQTTVIFGITKDGSLAFYPLASWNCCTSRNLFQNGANDMSECSTCETAFW